MGNLPCAAIMDLLPSYMEHLTSEETDRLIEEHISECPKCKEHLENMKGSIVSAPKACETEREQEQKTIDFLKKSRRRNVLIVVISLAAALLTALIIVFVNRYVAGYYYHDPSGELFSFDIHVEDRYLTAQITSVQNIYKITGVEFSENDGTVSMNIRAVPAGLIASMMYGNGCHASYQAETQITGVKANGRTVWQDGTDISMLASRIFNTAHPYIGDMPENQRTAEALKISDWLGPFISELKTGQKPYVWKLILEKDIPWEKASEKEKDMEAFACVMLGMIDNLDEVVFEYSTDGNKKEKALTTEQASEILGQDIKECMSNIDVLDALLEKTGLNKTAYNRYNGYDPASRQTVASVINSAQEQLESVTVTVYADGEVIESQTAMNADGSLINKGEMLQFCMDSPAFKDACDKDQDITISVRVALEDGSDHDVKGQLRIPPLLCYLYDIHITGDPVRGFYLEQ